MIKLLIAGRKNAFCDQLKEVIIAQKCNAKIVAIATTEEELLQKIEKNSPDLVLCDVKLSSGSSFGVIKKILKKGSKVRFAIVTEHRNFAHAREAVHLGIDKFLMLPVTNKAIVKLIQEDLAGVGEGGVTDVVPQGNGFNEIQVQVQGTADGTGDPGYQLHMQTSSGNVIVLYQREHLGLVGVPVVIGTIHDPVNVLGKGGTPYRRPHLTAETAQGLAVREGAVNKCAVVLFIFHTFRQRIGKSFFRHNGTSIVILLLF